MQAESATTNTTDEAALAAELLPLPLPHRTSQMSWRLLKLMIASTDLACVALSMLVAFCTLAALPDSGIELHRDGFVAGAASLPLWLLTFAYFGLYRTHIIASRIEEFRRIVQAAATTALSIILVVFTFRLDIAHSWLLGTVLVGVLVLTLERKVVRELLLRQRRHGRFVHNAVVVGINGEAIRVSEALARDSYLGYAVVGFLADTFEAGAQVSDGRSVLGGTHDALDVVDRFCITNVVVVTTAVDQGTSTRLVRELTNVGVHVELTSALSSIAAQRLNIRPFERFPMLHVEPVRRRGWRVAAKRGLDIVASAFMLVATAPVLVLAAAAIKVESPGPVLFHQTRLGKDSRLFHLCKLRTMIADAEGRLADLWHQNEADAPLFKLRDDPRVTRVGRVLRRHSIDELPQLWNVLRGEMSLVGPRPALPTETERWPCDLWDRLRVKPGITGMWQVRARTGSSFEDYVRLDLYYVDNWSLWSDLAILAKTIPAVITKRGAH